MKELIKINLYRLFRDKFFIVCTVLAAIITYAYCANGADLGIAHFSYGGLDAMKMVSIGIIGFLGVFSASFINIELSDGVIRNKKIIGHGQPEIYLSHLVCQFVAVIVMVIAWAIAGIAAGTPVNGDFARAVVNVTMFSASTASIVTLIAMKMRNKLTAAALPIAVIYLLFNFVLFGNFFLMSSIDTPFYPLMQFIYYLSPVGHWFGESPFGDSECSPALVWLVVIPMVVVVFTTLFGTVTIRKRELD